MCCATLGCGRFVVLKVNMFQSLNGELLLHLVGSILSHTGVVPKVDIDQNEATLLFRIPNDQLWHGFLEVPV